MINLFGTFFKSRNNLCACVVYLVNDIAQTRSALAGGSLLQTWQQRILFCLAAAWESVRAVWLRV